MPLQQECKKAAKTIRSFVDGTNQGLDGVIPRSVLERAAGFAIFTVVKVGFLASARVGSGLVIARLEDGGEFKDTPGELTGRLVATQRYRCRRLRIRRTGWCRVSYIPALARSSTLTIAQNDRLPHRSQRA